MPQPRLRAALSRLGPAQGQGCDHLGRRQRHRPRGRRCSSPAKAPRSRSSISRKTATPKDTEALVADEGSEALLIKGDIGDKAFCDEGGEEGHRQVGPARRRRQQRRRAARAEGADRHHRGAARADLPHQHLRLLLPDPGRAAAPQEGRRDHQHDLDHRLSRLAVADGLRRRPKARSSPSPAALAARWRRRASASTASRRVRSGRR